MTTGLIFAIEEFSPFDGPGIRSTVFLKGCPLRCSWCHNPEGQDFRPQMLKNPNGCLRCGRCTQKAISLTGRPDLIEESAAVCPRNLIRKSGEEYTPHRLIDRLLKNQRIYTETGGGVTFSGGEPLAQPDFLMECLTLLRGQLHRCLQTSGYVSSECFDMVLKECDHVLFDLKVIDPSLSRHYIGAGSQPILTNFRRLTESGIPFTVRIPLIPGVTDTEKNIGEIIGVLQACGVTSAEAMPYNTMAGAKYPLCGRQFLPDYDPAVPPRIPADQFRAGGIQLTVL